MRFTAVSALVGLLAVQLAAAGDSDWQCAPGFPICSKSTNQCTNPQKGGVSCAEESQPTSGSCTGVQGMGVLNANYGTMKCNSKRSLFPRGGGSSAGSTDQKCIMQTCGSTKGSGIQVNKGSGSQYSCNAHQIVVEQPTIVQITHYNENSNQTCSYHQLCNANEVTTISNDYCGQSDSHEVCVHPSSPSGPNVPIGIVQMNFDCVPAPSSSCSTPPASSPPATSSTPVVVPSKPVSPPLSTAPMVSPSVTPSAPSPIQSGTTSSPVVSPSSPVVSPSSPVVSPSSSSPIESGTTSPVVSTSSPVVSPSSPVVSPSSPSPIESGTTSPVVSTSSPVVSPSSPVVSPSVTPSSPSPIESATVTTPVPIETEYTSLTTYTTVTSCPVTSTTVISGSTSIIVSTVLTTSTITTCTRCAEKTSAPTPIQQGSTVPAPSPSSPAAPSPPAPATTSSVPSPPVVYTSTPVVITTTTEIVLTTLTTCPVTQTITPPHQTPTVVTTSTVSTVISTSTSTITTTTLSPPPSSSSPVVPGQSPSSSSSLVVPPSQPSPPSAFKGCISAFYDLKGCGSNTDYDCYCKQDEVTSKVYECITNYEQDVALQAQAMASYQGLCAQYVPQHPAIITKSVELIPTPVSIAAGSSPAVVAGTVTPAPASPAQAGQTTTTTAPVPGSPAPTSVPSSNVPSTTIPVSVIVTVPCSVAAGLVNQITDGQLQVSATSVMAPGCTTTSLLSTQLAVPQMHFATSGTSVGLAAGTPAPNQAGATASPASPVLGAAGAAGVAGASGSGSVPASSATSTPTATTFKGAAAKTSHSGVFLSVVLLAVGLVAYA